MNRLLIDTKAPFLTRFHDGTRSLNHFMLQRPDERRCSLPLSYDYSKYIGDGWQVGAQSVMVFKRTPQPEEKRSLHSLGELRGLQQSLRKQTPLRLAKKE